MQQKLLFTPGPLTTSPTVKEAMLRDLGSRDFEFIGVVADIRHELFRLANAAPSNYTAVIMQGSGTFGLEAVVSSVIPRDSKLLVLVNGAYGRRLVNIARVHQIETVVLEVPENTKPDAEQVASLVRTDPAITDVAVVHCETTSGIINPLEQIAHAVKGAGKRLLVDAMSSFGAYPIPVETLGVDFLVSSSNKCIEGVPGFSFVIANLNALEASKGNARTVSLNLFEQWRELERSGQFRFTPPTHALLAFHRALQELNDEGGITGRAERYLANYRVVVQGMRELGFNEYLEQEDQGYIITCFRYPEDPRFDFESFYSRLNQKGFVIYPGKVTAADCFRIGHIGRIYPHESQALVQAIKETLDEMGVSLTTAETVPPL
jgi:2-aminoethylphosphonate-pyruvate transaminase